MEITDPNVLAEIAKESFSAGWLVDFDFASGHQYYTDRAHPVVYGGNTYAPIGPFIGIEPIEQSADGKPNGLRLMLSGVDSSLIALAVGDTGYFGRDVTLYFAVFTEQDVLIGTSEPYIGVMSHPDINLGAENVVGITCESDLARWAKAKPLFSTDASQQRFFSGDTFFDQGPYLAGKVIYWGGVKQVSGGTGQHSAPRPPGYRDV